MLTLCNILNVPIKPSKVEGPTTSLTFLGINLNTITMEASITSERKQSLLQELSALHACNKCTKQELLSLIGKLSFSYKVLLAGRIFLRRLIDLSTTVKQTHHHIRLTADARLDMRWWLDLVRENINIGEPLEVQACNCLLMPQEPTVGAHIGMVSGYKANGQRHNCIWT